MKKHLFLAAVMPFSTQASSAITQVWTEESAFLSANSGLLMESFEQSGIPLTPNTNPILTGDITTSTDGSNFGSFDLEGFQMETKVLFGTQKMLPQFSLPFRVQ